MRLRPRKIVARLVLHETEHLGVGGHEIEQIADVLGDAVRVDRHGFREARESRLQHRREKLLFAAEVAIDERLVASRSRRNAIDARTRDPSRSELRHRCIKNAPSRLGAVVPHHSHPPCQAYPRGQEPLGRY